MRKILSLLVTVLFCTSMFASQEGTLTVSPEGVINPATEVTLNYDGTGTNFDKWEPKCFIYAWLVPADEKEFSKAYKDEWIACQGDKQYAAIAAKRKMAFVEKGKYNIQINIKEYFGVADEDLDKIARLGVIVCTQWVGGNEEDNNKTKDFFLDVNESQEPIIEPNFFVTGDSALVVDAGYDKAIAWKGDAIASYGDTIKLNLKAGQEYQLKVVAKGAWKGYNDLTEKAEGLQEIGLGNIGFKLAEAGEVQVIYTAELFKLIGNFYVPEPVYSLKNNWGGGADWTWVEMKKVLGDYYVLDTVFGGKGVNFSALESHADEKYIEAKDIPAFDREKKKVSLDALDTVRFGYIPSADSLFALIMGKYVEPVPVLEDGFYLISKSLEWNIANLTADQKFAPLENNDKEFILTATLTLNDAIKVVKVVKDKDVAWYPAGDETEFVITEDYTGEHEIYFQEEYKEDWKAFGGYFWMGKNEKPEKEETLNLVPRVWNVDDAKFAAWIYGDALEGKWTAFFEGEGDTLSAVISSLADQLVIVRFADTVAAPRWPSLGEEGVIWNRINDLAIDHEGLTLTIVDAETATWDPYIEPIPVDLEDGYYLNGTIAEWKLENLKPFKFIANPEKLGEFYVENVVLVEGDEIKACFVKDNAIDVNAWYGVGEGGANNNLVVTAEQAGKRTIYFNTTWQEDWKGYIYVDVSGGTGVENTDAAVKAVKTLKDGQLIIEKNGKRYNVLGAIVR